MFLCLSANFLGTAQEWVEAVMSPPDKRPLLSRNPEQDGNRNECTQNEAMVRPVAFKN